MGWISVPPARQMIGTPSRRATGVAATHENGIAARMASICRPRTSASMRSAIRWTART